MAYFVKKNKQKKTNKLFFPFAPEPCKVLVKGALRFSSRSNSNIKGRTIQKLN